MRARAALVAVALVAAPAVVLAQPDTTAAARARFDAAEVAARAGRYADALAAYRDAVAIAPSAPFALAARSRADDLAAHAEGDFAPLAALDAVRRDPARSRDRAELEALDRAADGFPAGRVRGEARLVVAEGFWHGLAEPARAISPLSRVVEDPAADRATRALALSELVAVRRVVGDLSGARADVERHPDLAPSVRAEVLRDVRRVRLRDGSIAALVALAGVGLVSFVRLARGRGVVRAWRDVARPLAAAFGLYLGAGGAVVVHLYGGDPTPFLVLGAGVVALDAVARAWRLASSRQSALARSLRAAACAAGVAAAAFLALERAGAGYLEGFGL